LPDAGSLRIIPPMPMTRLAWAVALLLVALRTALLVASVPSGRALAGDEPVYDELARNVLAGNGYTWHGEPYLFKPPGWPLTLAAIYVTLGHDPRMGVMVQGLFDGASALLAALLAWNIFRSRLAAVLAFLFMLGWPSFLRESRFLQTEPLFTLAVLTMLWTFQRLVRSPGWRSAAVVGVAAGLAALVRPTAPVLLAGLVLGWIVVERGRVRRHLPKLVVTAAAYLLVVSPWIARNARVFHHFIPVASGGGEFFYMGAVLETDGRWDNRRWGVIREGVLAPAEAKLGRRLDPVEADRVFLAAGLDVWRHHPWRSVQISLKRFGRLVLVAMGDGHEGLRWAFLVTLLGLYALALPAALAGLELRDSPMGYAGVIAVAIAFTAVVSAALYTNSRYFEPLRPIVLVLAAGTVASALAARSWRPSFAQPPAAARVASPTSASSPRSSR
jgi:4-amino-4-deoxy-L-arabinose transferase-like glycosyltransferase